METRALTWREQNTAVVGVPAGAPTSFCAVKLDITMSVAY
jgi:hypothetical protein